MAISSLPLYPSTAARKNLQPSQLSVLYLTIANALLQTLELPPAKRDTPSTRNFVASYAKDAAQQALQDLIFPKNYQLSHSERVVRSRTLQLAGKLVASESAPLRLDTLVDLSVVYAPANASRVVDLWAKACLSPRLLSDISSGAVPSFTTTLSPARIQAAGLYGTRKTAQILTCIIRSLPPHAISLFARDKLFMLALAYTYRDGLSLIASSYGALQPFDTAGASTTVDDWQPIWMETKVALLDTFHLLLRALLDDVSQSGLNIATTSNRAFDIVFALLEADGSSEPPRATSNTPFYNCSIIADYRQAYDLSATLRAVLRKANAARMDELDATLQSLGISEGGTRGNLGALKILLRSSGVAPGIDHKGKGKTVQTSQPPSQPVPSSARKQEDPDVDAKAAAVLSILPDYDSDYVRTLLIHPDYPFRGDPEKVIEALLEGRAPPPEEMQAGGQSFVSNESLAPRVDKIQTDDQWEFTRNRKNVFDNETLDMSNVHYGKKTNDATSFMRTPAYSEEEKADLLRRAQETLADSDEDSVDFGIDVVGSGMGLDNLTGKTKGKARDLAFEDELDLGGVVRVGGGGSDDSGNEDEEDEGAEYIEGWSGAGGEGTPAKVDPEFICELAYIDDASVFERDGQTRRGKARVDLRNRTGWSDEQIEGWKIMLERDPKRKEKVLRKHEFSGNKPAATRNDLEPSTMPTSERGRGGARGGRGRGRGGGHGRGSGRGGRGGGSGGGGGGGGDETGDRAWKDKNKASRANHNRKRGHDKKMARAGAGPSQV